MSKKVKPCPGWLATFADLMSLLMAMFVLLYAMSSTDVPKYKSVVESLTDALGHGEVLSQEQVEYFEKVLKKEVSTQIEKTLIEDLKPLYESLLETFSNDTQSAKSIQIEYEESKDQIKVTFPEQIAFDTGSAELKPGFAKMLVNFQGFKRPDIVIKVIGHTDTRPVSGGRFVSNWELSSARASSVIVELLNQDLVNQNQVEAIGVADTMPLIDEQTLQAYTKNRRVEVLISTLSNSVVK